MQIKLSEVREYLIGLVKQGGPAVEEYEKLSRCLADLATIKSQGLVSGESIRSLFLELGSAMTPQTVQGFAFTKPRGYAGDFEIIERIYQQWISPSPDLAKWDHYFHAQSAPKAVRGRKQYFQDWLATWEKVNGNAGFRVLNIASGSARDVFEYFTNNPESKIHFDCVDQDANAITYAAKLCERFGGANFFL